MKSSMELWWIMIKGYDRTNELGGYNVQKVINVYVPNIYKFGWIYYIPRKHYNTLFTENSLPCFCNVCCKIDFITYDCR